MKVLIADDHPMMRDALARTLRVLEPQAVLLEAADFAGTERAIAEQAPDLLLLDLHMPGMEGVASLCRLRERFGALTMVVASGENDPATIRAVMQTGVSGFLPKSESPQVLLGALRLVLAGGTFVPLHAMQGFDAPAAALPRGGAGQDLTPRQRDVLQLLMRGEPNKRIARSLGLTEGTVKIHIAAILRALPARNRTEAAMIARARGLGE